MYALVNGSFILLGPIGFNYRLINSTIKDDLNLDYNVGPLDYMNVPINFNDQLKILPVVNNIPHHNRKTEYANMIRWEIGEDRLTYFYEILPIPLDKLKQQYKEKITNERWHKENNGNITVTINDIEIKVATKRENRSQLASKISAMSADVRRRFKFQNTWIELKSDNVSYPKLSKWQVAWINNYIKHGGVMIICNQTLLERCLKLYRPRSSFTDPRTLVPDAVIPEREVPSQISRQLINLVSRA